MNQEGLKIKNGDSTQIVSPPYIPWDAIVIQNGFGYISFAALRILLSLHVTITMLDFQGHLLGHMAPYSRRTGDLKMAQFQASSNPKKRLAIAKSIATRGYHRRGLNPPFSSAETLFDLVHLESRTADSYWAKWKAKLAEVWPDHDFDKRDNPRYSTRMRAVNRVNCTLNYSYALLETACRTTIFRAGLQPEIGFLHVEQPHNKEPLVYDFMELGRAWIDQAVLSWLSKKENRTDFKRQDDWVIRLKPESTRGLIDHISRAIKLEVLWHDARDVLKKLV